MKEQLNRENIEALSAYRFLRAKETLKEIPYLKQQGYYNTAVNRLYYACYYAAVALLIKHEINPGTHAGVKQMIGLHFVPVVCHVNWDVVFPYFSNVGIVVIMMILPIQVRKK